MVAPRAAAVRVRVRIRVRDRDGDGDRDLDTSRASARARARVRVGVRVKVRVRVRARVRISAGHLSAAHRPARLHRGRPTHLGPLVITPMCTLVITPLGAARRIWRVKAPPRLFTPHRRKALREGPLGRGAAKRGEAFTSPVRMYAHRGVGRRLPHVADPALHCAGDPRARRAAGHVARARARSSGRPRRRWRAHAGGP